MKKRRNKKYVPKPMAAIPIIFGLASEKKTDLRLPYHLSLEALRTGNGTADDAHTIFSSLLIGRELARLYQSETQQTVMSGIDAIAAVKERGDQGKWGVSGEQFKAISEALVLVDEMQDASTRREVRDAIKTVWKEAA